MEIKYSKCIQFLCFMLLVSVSTVAGRDSIICQSTEIKVHEDLLALRYCNIVLGHVRIANLPEKNGTFDLSTAVEEITDYLLVYRADGIKSLQQIFPKLKLIRGRELLFDEYALAVAENRFMFNLGLNSLLRVQQGNIRIESNPSMCFVETINWIYLLENATSQHFSIKNNRHPNECPLCKDDDNSLIFKNKPHFIKYCWDYSDAYQLKAFTPPSYKCTDNCHPAMGCKTDKTSGCCDRNCLSQCSSDYCYQCSSLRMQGKCVKSCRVPNLYVNNKRDCIAPHICRTLGKIPYNGACINKCPKYYNTLRDPNGVLTCKMSCKGSFIIKKIEDLKALHDCTTIQGSLSIELTNIKTKVSDLEKVLFQIKEIQGYLKVTRSPQLVSLNFLKNLDTIRGDELIENKYALYVVNNQHLEHIWQVNQNVVINKGRIYFHLNPRLCFNKILKLKPKDSEISFADVSPNSNGERVICDKAVYTLNATVEDKNATAARIKVNPISAEYKDVLVGYLHHYKEAPVQNVTMYDGRHGCGHDNWLMDISIGKNVRHVLSNLKPYTQYAYFVKTLTMTDYHMQLDAYSEIQYFHTSPDKPGKVRKIYFHAPSAGEVVLHWWPPRYPNGVIEYYLINSESITKTLPSSIFKSLRPQEEVDETCECNLKDPNDSGPQPEDQNYYNRDQITYDETIPNIIYISRRQLEMEAKNKKKRRKIDKNNNTLIDTGKQIRSVNENAKDSNVTNATDKKKNDEIEEKENKRLEEVFRNFHIEYERKALAQQDTGIADFPITKPSPVCDINNPSAQFQLENSCVPRENYSGIKVTGTVFAYTLKDLKPELTYRISIRACVKDLINGCGKETSIEAQTVSKTLDDFIKHIKLNQPI